MIDTRYTYLDGLRCVAFLGVYVFHATQAWPNIWHWTYLLGTYGVQTFFVLSGFLIGGILLDIRAKGIASVGPVMKAFYARRSLRIFPAYYLTLALIIILSILGFKDLGQTSFVRWHAVYLTNIAYFIARSWPGCQSHLWTLSVEEQFYLIAPFALLLMPFRTLCWTFVSIWLGCAVMRWYCWTIHDDFIRLLTPMQMDSLTVGIAAAIVKRSGSFLGLTFERLNRFGPVVWCLALGTLINTHPDNRSVAAEISQPFAQWLFAVTTASLILRSINRPNGRLAKSLSHPSLVYLGQISYGLYLCHLFCIDLFRYNLAWFADRQVVGMVAAFVLSVGVASISWFVVERPLNRYKTRFPYPKGLATVATEAELVLIQ